MTAPTVTRPAQLCDRCHHELHADPNADLGFGYSRDSDTPVAPTPVPDGVVLIALTGRIPRGTR
jgi:hypothetical protein